MSKNQIKSLLERLKQAAAGHALLGDTTQVKRADLEAAISLIAKLSAEAASTSMPVNN